MTKHDEALYLIEFEGGKLTRAKFWGPRKTEDEEIEVERSDDSATVYLIADNLESAIGEARIAVGDERVTGRISVALDGKRRLPLQDVRGDQSDDHGEVIEVAKTVQHMLDLAVIALQENVRHRSAETKRAQAHDQKLVRRNETIAGLGTAIAALARVRGL